MSDEPRAYTKEEMRDTFVAHMKMLARYWANEKPSPAMLASAQGSEALWRCEGLLHSFLCVLDGSTDLPAFDLMPSPHPEDEAYHRDEGSNWWDPEVVINDDVHLHDLLHR